MKQGRGVRVVARRVVGAVLLLGLALSSVEVLWAEEASHAGGATTIGGDDGLQLPPSPEDGDDDCPCLCACACANVQVVVLPDPATEQVAVLVPVRTPMLAGTGPSHLLPEPLLPPPRA